MCKNYSGVLYFYIHFSFEVLCFYYLNMVMGDNLIIWLVPFIYDLLAFVPQILFGAISDYFAKIPFGIIGVAMMTVGLLLSSFAGLPVLPTTIIIAIGNAFAHINGAEVTLRSGKGKITPAAVFVSGGSFGVVAGKVLASYTVPAWVVLVIALTAIPMILIAEKYRTKADEKNDIPCKAFRYANPNLPVWLITIIATFVVMVRSFMGYCIPTSWNTTLLQAVLLFSFMGIGKALGGVLVDKIGMRKTILISTIGAIPFLIFGNEIMIISLIGLLLFSMTMAITLAILVSAYPKNPGVAFGFTTIGLFLGVLPVFFHEFSNILINDIIIIMVSVICSLLLLVINKGGKNA